jgi:MHS family proline/betaine transporter-like MFS transporter
MELSRSTQDLRKYVAACLIGNGLEWYDFALFGYFAPIISSQFFPSSSAYTALIKTFAVFAVGFLSRPFGAYFFGKMGDQYGRKKAMVASVFLMAISTSLMGALPSYESIGLWAPCFLALLRIFQGMSIGGEFTSSLTFLLEHSAMEKRGFIGSWTYVGSLLGMALASLTGAIATYSLSQEALVSWGWRIPFFLGFGVALYGYYLRKSLSETPIFINMKNLGLIAHNPFQALLRGHLKDIFQIVCVFIPNTVLVYLLFFYLPAYMTMTLGWTFFETLAINLFALTSTMLFLPVAGYLSDIYGRKQTIALGLCLTLICSPLIFYLISQQTLMSTTSALLAAAFLLSLSYGPTGALLADQFPAPLRNTGMSISYHLSTGVFGGLTPLILTWLSSFTHGLNSSIAWTMIAAVIGLMGLYMIKTKDSVYRGHYETI